MTKKEEYICCSINDKPQILHYLYVLEENNKDISVRLGSLWKSLSFETKETYYSAATKAHEEHRLKYGVE